MEHSDEESMKTVKVEEEEPEADDYLCESEGIVSCFVSQKFTQVTGFKFRLFNFIYYYYFSWRNISDLCETGHRCG